MRLTQRFLLASCLALVLVGGLVGAVFAANEGHFYTGTA
jgi:hypothetical protein